MPEEFIIPETDITVGYIFHKGEESTRYVHGVGADVEISYIKVWIDVIRDFGFIRNLTPNHLYKIKEMIIADKLKL